MKVVAEYESLILEVQRLSLKGSNKVMRGGRFTGWLWEVAGLVGESTKRETEKGKETKNESEREKDKVKGTEKENYSSIHKVLGHLITLTLGLVLTNMLC